jgi:hypothetical protein
MTTDQQAPSADPDVLPRWSVADVHASLDARSFGDAKERAAADVDRLIAQFDELGIGATDRRTPTAEDGAAATIAIDQFNRTADALDLLDAYVYSIVSTDSRDDRAQSVMSELQVVDARLRPLLARLADWVASLGIEDLARHSQVVLHHREPFTALLSGPSTRCPTPTRTSTPSCPPRARAPGDAFSAT